MIHKPQVTHFNSGNFQFQLKNLIRKCKEIQQETNIWIISMGSKDTIRVELHYAVAGYIY